jgi:hypothetical protein
MNKLALRLALAVIVLLMVHPVSHAQTLDIANSSLLGNWTCNPASCYLASGWVTSGYYRDTFDGTCYPSPNAQHARGVPPSFALHLAITAWIGVKNGACSTPVYVAENYGLPTTFFPYDDGACHQYAGYEVDYVEPEETVTISGGKGPAYYNSVTYGCDGTETGQTSFGTLPC